jgi:hypothetical protein
LQQQLSLSRRHSEPVLPIIHTKMSQVAQTGDRFSDIRRNKNELVDGAE